MTVSRQHSYALGIQFSLFFRVSDVMRKGKILLDRADRNAKKSTIRAGEKEDKIRQNWL